MNSKIYFFILFILLTVLNGCVSEFNTNLPDNDVQMLIVDGNIIENTDVTFYLSKSFPLSSPNRPAESYNIQASLSIIGSDGYKSQPAVNLGRGEYRIYVGELNDNVKYGIQIDYNGDIYQSELTKPLHTPEIDSISWVQPEEKGEVFFRISTHDDSGEAKFFLWNFIENWEITAYYRVYIFFDPDNNNFYTDYDSPYYYCWKKNISDKFLIGSTESLRESRLIDRQLYGRSLGDDRFSNLYSVTVTQKTISKSAFEYYQNKIVLNDEMGGIFTPQPSELTGNITCISDPSKKVMGYVETVKNTSQKRIFVYSREISRPSSSNCSSITNDSLQTILDEIKGNYVDAYKLGYRPITEVFMTPEEWSFNYCTECTANGGSKNKPDFWPNSHQ